MLERCKQTSDAEVRPHSRFTVPPLDYRSSVAIASERSDARESSRRGLVGAFSATDISATDNCASITAAPPALPSPPLAMRILLVEDSARVAETVSASLAREGHRIEIASTCAAAQMALAAGHFTLAIIDVGLPDGSGLDVCRSARQDGHSLPILLLTARTLVSDRVQGLDAGADDYLAKPFAPDELHARVRALGRRGPSYRETVLTFEDLVVDGDRRMVTRRGSGEQILLTAREFDIVVVLASRRGRVVMRDDILDCVWGDISPSAAASLEVLVARIRRKIDGASGIKKSCIRTHRQVGYAWQLEVSKGD